MGHVRSVSLVEDKVAAGGFKTTVGGNWQWPLLITVRNEINHLFINVDVVQGRLYEHKKLSHEIFSTLIYGNCIT